MGSTNSTSERTKKFILPEKSGALYELKKDPSNLQETVEFKYIDRKQITHDTFIYTYKIPNNLTLGLNIGQHLAIEETIKTKDKPEGEVISRKYTPVSWIKEEEGGIMSQHLNNLELDKSTIKCRGPLGRFKYLGDGNAEIITQLEPKKDKLVKFNKLLCIAGGTGITPIYQIINAVYSNQDPTDIILIFGNKTTKDFLLKDELDNIQRCNKINIKIIYTIDKSEEGWEGEVGFINKDMISKYCKNIEDNRFVLTCGPPPMTKSLPPILKQLGMKDDNYFKF